MDFIFDMFDGEKKDRESKKEGKKSKDGLKPKEIIKQRDAFCKSSGQWTTKELCKLTK